MDIALLSIEPPVFNGFTLSSRTRARLDVYQAAVKALIETVQQKFIALDFMDDEAAYQRDEAAQFRMRAKRLVTRAAKVDPTDTQAVLDYRRELLAEYAKHKNLLARDLSVGETCRLISCKKHAFATSQDALIGPFTFPGDRAGLNRAIVIAKTRLQPLIPAVNRSGAIDSLLQEAWMQMSAGRNDLDLAKRSAERLWMKNFRSSFSSAEAV